MDWFLLIITISVLVVATVVLWIRYKLIQVNVTDVCPVIYCNKRTQICSIKPRDSNKDFNSFEDNIRPLQPGNGSLRFEIERGQRALNVYCTASEIGEAKIILDIGNMFRFIDTSELSLTVRPFCPERLTVLDPNKDNAYVGRKVQVEIASYDCFGNEASACKHKVFVQSDPENAVDKVDSKMRDGKYHITLQCNTECKAQIRIQLSTDGYRLDGGHCCPVPAEGAVASHVESFPLDISYPPISAEQSTVKIISTSTNQVKAGTPITLEVDVKDIFGQPIHRDLDYNVFATIGPESHSMPTYSQSKKFIRVMPTQAGQHPVKVVLNEKSLPVKRWMQVLPSVAKYLNFQEDLSVLYYGDWSSLQAKITDEHGNIATQLTHIDKCEFQLEAFDSDGFKTELQWKDLKLDRGNLEVKLRIEQLGKHTLVVRLSNKTNLAQSLSRIVDIDVIDSPCSSLLTQQQFNKECAEQTVTSGSEFKFHFQVYDVFGNAVRIDSTAECSIRSQVSPPLLRTSGEFVNVERDSQSASLRFNVTVRLTLSGAREVQLVVNSDNINSMTRPIQVIPSSPHHLNNLHFTTRSSSNPNFLTMEADVVDEYENVVAIVDDNYEIILMSSNDQGNKTKVNYKDELVKAGRLRINVNVEEVKEQKLSVTLVDKNDEHNEHELQQFGLQAIEEASFSSAASKGEELHTITGGSEYKFRIFPFDTVVGPETANSTAKYKSSGESLAVDKGLVGCRNVSKQGCVEVSVTLKTAGETHLEVFDDGKKTLHAKLEVKPDLDNIQCEHTTENVTSVYTKEPLLLTTVVKDRFGNNIPLDGSRPPRLVQKSGPKRGLQTRSEASKIIDNISSIGYQFFNHGNYVLSLQCPNLRADYMDVEEFTVNVQNAPVDLQRSTVIWSPEFQDMPDQPLFIDDEDFKCVVKLKDLLDNTYMGDMESVQLSVVYNNKQVTVEEKKILGPGALQVTVPLDVFQINSAITAEFSFILNGDKIGAPLRLTFIGNLKYDDSRCVVGSGRHGEDVIECKDETKNEIRGEDNCHLDNIRRICQLKYSDRTKVEQELSSTLLVLPQLFPSYQLETCQSSVLHLVRALSYRKRASEADREREKWKDRAKKSYDRMETVNKRGKKRDCPRPSFCKKIKENYAKLMAKYHREACEEIFTFYNTKRDQSEIDLHGLLVADEEKLEKYKQQIEMQGKDEEDVTRIIEEEREDGDEAIRKLRDGLATAQEARKAWLEIIVGAGHHSQVPGRQMIRPKVETYLRKQGLEFLPVNEGAMVVIFEEYPSRDRCFGEYYCKECKKAWKSGRSWKDKYQACYRCYQKNQTIVKCFPLKQKPLQTGSRRAPEETGHTPVPHLPKLCEKCTDLGSACDGK